MKIVKTLFLDQPDYLYIIFGNNNKDNIIYKNKGGVKFKIEIVSNKFLDDCYVEEKGRTFPGESPMYADFEPYYSGFKETIKDFTENKKVNLIIIGNNCGAGVFKAEAVADDIKDKTIIVWHDLCEDEQEKTWPYRRLGFRHFAERKDMKQTVLKIISKRDKKGE